MPKTKNSCPFKMITFLCVHTERNDRSYRRNCCQSCCLRASIIRSACSNRLTDKNISILLLLATAAAVFYRCATDKNAFSFHRLATHLANCVIALSQINTFHTIYLLTWCFSSNKFLMRCYISCTFCFCALVLSFGQSVLDIYLYQIGTSRAGPEMYDEISYSKLIQSIFCPVNFLCFELSNFYFDDAR